MKFGYLRQDDDSHWYLIPEDNIVEFDDDIIDMEMTSKYSHKNGYTCYSEYYLKLEKEFNDNYREYRLKSCIEDLKVIIDENI